jgi:hypothetical protein
VQLAVGRGGHGGACDRAKVLQCGIGGRDGPQRDADVLTGAVIAGVEQRVDIVGVDEVLRIIRGRAMGSAVALDEEARIVVQPDHALHHVTYRAVDYGLLTGA